MNLDNTWVSKKFCAQSNLDLAAELKAQAIALAPSQYYNRNVSYTRAFSDDDRKNRYSGTKSRSLSRSCG